MPSSGEIRRQFVDYFVKKHGHTDVPSSPVVPHDDPTLLFANAGMNQFKDVFLATGTRPYSRAVNTQKCIRAGGKHNDLEDVGRDTYHHTFFEMLGNWSFGDYFKKEAIAWAWDLLTNVWGLEKDRLHVTVFAGDLADGLNPDAEAQGLWQSQTDIDPSHIHLFGKKDNFWEMGEVGPCGPCSEIHIDLTPDKSGAGLVNAGDARVIEIWNLVFIQFNRDAAGKLTSLPAKHVDTGMGFERVCAVLQGKTSNYDTDVFAPIFEAIRGVTGAAPYSGRLDDSVTGKVDMAYRVIADHVRCLTFALTDGAVPSNDGRGYVLRRILRRAVRHGNQTLGMNKPFLYRLVPTVVDAMGDVFPELKKDPDRVGGLIKEEEQSFGKTLERGIELWMNYAGTALWKQFQSEQKRKPKAERLHMWSRGGLKFYSETEQQEEEDRIAREGVLPIRADSTIEIVKLSDIKEIVHKFKFGDTTPELMKQLVDGVPVISGEGAFKLHDTYGFPLDLTQVMAQERSMAVDVEGFERLMQEAREKARAGGGRVDAGAALTDAVGRDNVPATQFLGYDKTESDVATFCLLYKRVGSGYERVASAQVGDELAVVVGHTPFYAEAGGQVGDTGTIENKHGGVFRVRDTVKIGAVHFHLGEVGTGEFVQYLPGEADTGVDLKRCVDRVRRAKIMANHTGTHLMNRALRDVLGEHVQQKGSLVDDEKLRFDFSHNAAVSDDEVDRIEQMVNHDIGADLPVYAQEADQQEALKINSLRAVFGEKYPPRVRVVSVGMPVAKLLAEPSNTAWQGYSIEFCGGTHLAKTGDAQGLVVVSEEAVAKGVRRITALTGQTAHRAAAQGEMLLSRIEGLGDMAGDQLADQVAQLGEQISTRVLPLLVKAMLREGLARLQKKVKEHDKQRNKASAGAVVEQARKLAEESAGEVVVASLSGADAASLRTAMDVIRKKRPETALLLGGVNGQQVAFVAAVPKAMIDRGLKAGDWVREVAKAAGGGGGGRPDMAQAGGKDPAKFDQALDVGREFAKSKL